MDSSLIRDASAAAMSRQKKEEAARPLPNEPESLRKLRALKEKIQREYENEKREREMLENEEPIMPISLANEKSSLPPPRKSPHSTVHPAQMGYGSGHVPLQTDPHQLLRDKINQLKVDKVLQRELETELTGKFAEMNQLKAQNKRLRDILTLRESSNTRKEATLENEISYLKNLMDDVCVESRDHAEVIAKLTSMNKEIQVKASMLKSTIEAQAEAERLALIRTYRVRIRDLKQQLAEQEAANLDGAKAWIDRFQMLDHDRQDAQITADKLDSQNSALRKANSEIRVMQKHQDEQRDSLTHKIALLKRENKRFEEHIAELQTKLDSSPKEAQQPPLQATRSRSAAQGQQPQPQLRLRPSTSGAPSVLGEMADRQQAEALARMRKALEVLRSSLKQVRTAHIELLQERTELEIFLRQCIEDVRKDMYQFTASGSGDIKTTAAKQAASSGAIRVLEQYGAQEKRQLMNILNSKLQILSLMHQKMFPTKKLPEMLGDKLMAVSGKGPLPGAEETQSNSDVDTLWERWQCYVRTETPPLK